METRELIESRRSVHDYTDELDRRRNPRADGRGHRDLSDGGFDPDAIREEFGIEGSEPVMVIAMGYPAEDAPDIEQKRKLRRPVSKIVHEGSF